MANGRRERWVVIREGQRTRWGGELTRRMLFAALAERTGATVVDRWSSASLLAAARGPRWRSLAAPFLRRPRLASSEQLPESMITAARRYTDPSAVAVYDDAVAQLAALGISLPADRLSAIRRRRELNEALFRWHVVPTASFAALAGLDPARVIVGRNGTDVDHIRPGPWPAEPAIGLVSGAAPGRGIEALIAAARSVRSSIPEVRLLLWLVATSAESQTYLDGLAASVAGDPWIELGSAPYASLGEQLARASVLCIAHPANPYMDVALPVKLLDSMAAGRPLLVTPRTETRAIVEEHGAGVVVAGDTADDLADGLLRLLGDEPLARRLGAAARHAAESTFAWPIIGGRIADEILRREGGRPR
ncbi:MAG TPA: glycosyltransferase family 4 protein [Candidatus Limnocylindrales bacterium]|nr:glycosyltransferase family 4 protein [Candidatus Limnocylindrales bacterium]